MELSEKKQFFDLLGKTFAAYAKPLPEGALLAAWWDELQPFPAAVVMAAFNAYRQGGTDFVPNPAAIARRCVLCDGRPSVDEAWSIAIASRSESETVVWTEEIAGAFAACSSVFPDEVGARMAFKDAYSRLVNSARGLGRPAKWSVSLGWDMRKREAVLNHAAAVGLLPAPEVTALIGYAGEVPAPDQKARDQIQKIKDMLAEAEAKKQAAAYQREEADRKAVVARKQELAEQAASLSGSSAW